MTSLRNIVLNGFTPPITSTAEEESDLWQVELERRNKFFVIHRDEQWFKDKYHPDDSLKKKKKRTLALKKRLEVFNEFLANGKIDSVSVDTNNRETLVDILDSVITKLQEGTDFYLTAFNFTKTISTQQEPEHEKKEIKFRHVFKNYAGGNSECVVDSDVVTKKGDETNTIDKSEVNSTEETMDEDDLEIFNIWRGRILSVNGITNHFEVASNDMRQCAKIIKAFDECSGLYQSIEGEHPAMGKTYKVVISYLEEASAEEEKLLGESVPSESEVNTEIHKQVLKALDRMILYLRIVHSIDFYKYIEYAYEDDMEIGSSVMHVRCLQTHYLPTQQDIAGYCHNSQSKADSLIQSTIKLSYEQISLIGGLEENTTMDSFIIEKSTKKISRGKWKCKLSGKIFKKRKDVGKHLLKNYRYMLDNANKEIECFNNFLQDPNRPNQIPHSYPAEIRYELSDDDSS